jgi:solute carrier family 35 protein F5
LRQINAVASFVSDISWALAMLLTTPLVVTVGLSLTIPLSLIGEMVQYQQYSSFVYWIGAAVVFVSFVFVNHETKEEDTGKAATGATAVDADDEGVVYGTP